MSSLLRTSPRPSVECPRGHIQGRTSAIGRPSAALPLLLIVGAAASVPAPLVGQTGVVLAAHVGSTATAPGGVMVDVASEIRQGLWGLRVGMDAAGTALAPILSPAETSSGERASTVVPTWSWGARAGVPVFTWLAMELEARNRHTFTEVSPAEYPIREGWEYRAGLALRFGGSTRARARSAPPTGRNGTITPPTSDNRDGHRSARAEGTADAALASADRLVGVPYRWSGASPRGGFDCSGFVQYVFRQQGIELPRVSRNQARAGISVETSFDGLAKGDLLFFALRGSSVDHVAVYAGDDRMVHASSSGGGVRYDDLTSDRGRWYARRLVSVRRVIIGREAFVQGVRAEEPTPGVTRSLPLGEAVEVMTGESGDDDAPPPGG